MFDFYGSWWTSEGPAGWTNASWDHKTVGLTGEYANLYTTLNWGTWRTYFRAGITWGLVDSRKVVVRELSCNKVEVECYSLQYTLTIGCVGNAFTMTTTWLFCLEGKTQYIWANILTTWYLPNKCNQALTYLTQHSWAFVQSSDPARTHIDIFWEHSTIFSNL